ncbi:MAG: FHA domain-containing protein [candidate division Zixibacteria bacterium]|nr:FHA domain-containing protein [candidate division Zixibacteria bacterium]
MARFIVLKGSSNYTVFDFDGNICRVGSGENVDLRLDSVGTEDDLFYLTRTVQGYQLEPRASGVKIAVNSRPVKGNVPLEEGSKISILDYMIVVTYQSEESSPPLVQEDVSESKPPEESTAPPISSTPEASAAVETPPAVEEKATAPEIATPSPAPEFSREPPVAPPVPRGATDEDKTVRIDLEGGVPPLSRQPLKSEVVTDTRPKIEPIYSLVGLSGQHNGKVFYIDREEFVIGRDRDCNLAIDRDEKGQQNLAVSRKHFVITSTEGGLYLTDKISRLRTYVNGKVIEADQREPITPEDIISIRSSQGEIKFRLCYADNPNLYPDKPEKSTWKWILFLLLVIVFLIIVWFKFIGNW